MPSIVTIRPRELRLTGPGFVAERYTANMKRVNWLRLRQSGFGGSDRGFQLFPDDQGGPMSVYFDKLTPISGDGGEINWQLDFGNFMEDPMRASVLPTYLCRAGLAPDQFRIYTSPWFYRKTDLPWWVCNVDGLIEFLVDCAIEIGDGIVVNIPKGLYVLELKTAQWSQAEKWIGGSTPDRYFVQSKHYVGGLDLQGAVVFVMIGNMPSLRFLPRNQKFLDYLAEDGAERWRQIEAHEPPMAFGGDADLRATRALFAEGGGAKAFPGLELLGQDLIEARARKKNAEADVKALEAQLKSSIGDAEALVDTRAEVRWKRWGMKKFDAEAFRQTYPALYERFKTREEPGSRLTVTVKGVTSDDGEN
jgi:hypothetical protein